MCLGYFVAIAISKLDKTNFRKILIAQSLQHFQRSYKKAYALNIPLNRCLIISKLQVDIEYIKYGEIKLFKKRVRALTLTQMSLKQMYC